MALFTPTPSGWHLRVGCWDGTVEELRELIATDDGWPEAEGEECARRRPSLQSLIAMCEAHTTLNKAVLDDIEKVWTEEGVRR